MSVPINFIGTLRPHAELMAAGAEWRAWRIWSSPWYLRWRRLLRSRRPKSQRLTIAEQLYFLTFDDSPILKDLRTRLYDTPKGISVEESFLFPPRS